MRPTVECDTNLATRSLLELFTVGLDRQTVGNENVMADDPRLGAAVTNVTLCSIARVSRGELSHVVSQHCRTKGLVERDPILDLGQCGEHDLGIVGKIRRKLVLVQETAISFVKLIGQVPMEQGDKRHNAGVEQVVDKLDIVFKTLFVDGVISATEGNDSRPGDGKSVDFGAEFLEQLNVLVGAVVGITSDIARGTTGDFAGDLGKGIPDGRPSTIGGGSAFNLVAGIMSACHEIRLG